MKIYVYDQSGMNLLRIEEAEPVCGKDFCDRCGECLACYGGDECWTGSEYVPDHFWVKYEEAKGEE